MIQKIQPRVDKFCVLSSSAELILCAEYHFVYAPGGSKTLGIRLGLWIGKNEQCLIETLIHDFLMVSTINGFSLLRDSVWVVSTTTKLTWYSLGIRHRWVFKILKLSWWGFKCSAPVLLGKVRTSRKSRFGFNFHRWLKRKRWRRCVWGPRFDVGVTWPCGTRMLALSMSPQVNFPLKSFVAKTARKRLVSSVFAHVRDEVGWLWKGFWTNYTLVWLLSWKERKETWNFLNVLITLNSNATAIIAVVFE